jgi:UDP-glucose 4-epimerase
LTIAWVIGSAGLLGAALCRALREGGTELFVPDARFSWNEPGKLPSEMAAAVQAFARKVQGSRGWEVHWAAGIGTMGSRSEELAPETRAIALFIGFLAAEDLLMSASGTLTFASSAGAIYAGTADEIITELTVPVPTTAYAIEKLRQEELVRAFVAAHPKTRALIARISTIYGPGQATAKKQGLLGYMARSIIRNQVINIFVPYDTVRDYIDADDAAVFMIAALRSSTDPPKVRMKIIASEYPATIAEIVSIFRRLSRRTPRVVRSANRLSALYTRRVRFRSIDSANDNRPPAKRLPVGISQLMKAEHLAFIRAPAGRLTLPPAA